MEDAGSEVRGVVIAAIAGIAVNVLSSFFAGDIALLILLLCVATLVAVFWRRESAHSGGRNLDRPRLVGSARFLAVAFLIGAGLAWVAILPVFPGQSFTIPGVDRLDLGNFFWLQGLAAHGYELLAAAFIAVMALVALIRGQHVLIIAQFVLAAAAGVVVVLAAAAPDFAEPVVTYVGTVVGVLLFLCLCMALPGAGRVIADFFRISRHHEAVVEVSREGAASSGGPPDRPGDNAQGTD